MKIKELMSSYGNAVEREGKKRQEPGNLKRDLWSLGYRTNLVPAVSDVCVGGHVSVRHGCSCTDEFSLPEALFGSRGLRARLYLKAD